jgi:hypothetical protein
MILREATIRFAGYDPDELALKSHKKVCISCDNPDCTNPIRWVRKYRDGICKKCLDKNFRGKNHPNWKGGLVTKICIICGDEYKVDSTRKDTAKFCSNKCKGKWMEENRKGENNSNWQGGTDKYQKHLVPIIHSIQLNKRFSGSEGHHINKDTVIFIPVELHKHIYHNLKNGQGIDEMNILAYQFLKGEYIL